MTDGELHCNFKKCRKVLSGVAYITRCSHAFCQEDGLREIESNHSEKKCPACRSTLTQSYDLVKVNLNPCDQFKSMVLAGLRPEVIMDVATRGIMFWSYQLYQEHLHQELVSKNLRDIITQMKTENQVEIGALKSDIQALKRKIDGLEKELANQKLKNQDLAEKLTGKTREAQKWQMECEAMRRKQLEPMVLSQETKPKHIVHTARSIGLETMDELMGNKRHEYPAYTEQFVSPKRSAREQGFIFQPNRSDYRSPRQFMGNNEGEFYRRN